MTESDASLLLLDDRREIAVSLDDMLGYNGGGAPGGVAHAFKVLERALPLLEPSGLVERRKLLVATPFSGPGARDGFELATRAVTEHRYVLDETLVRRDLGRARERFVFRLGYEGRSIILTLRAGFVTDEFIGLARQDERSAAERARLEIMKQQMAERLLAAPAREVYDADDQGARA